MQAHFLELHCPPLPKPPSRLEELSMACEGTAARVAAAKVELQHFHSQYSLLIDLRWYFRAESFAERQQLEVELARLHCELDEAVGYHNESLEYFAQKKRRVHVGT